MIFKFGGNGSLEFRAVSVECRLGQVNCELMKMVSERRWTLLTLVSINYKIGNSLSILVGQFE